MDASQYVKLRKQRTLFSSSTLYEADDHLLVVEGIVRQRYWRFYFDKIQAITVRPTRWAMVETMVLLVILGGLIGFSVFAVAIARPLSDALVPLLLGNSVWIALMLYVLYRYWRGGGSQDIFIQTAVQNRRIRSLGSRRGSEEILARIRNRIETAQGGPLIEADVPIPPDKNRFFTHTSPAS